ncbi:MFS transporter [Shimia thalassica]|uniref:MFS transporter n=1 Tax=Shimia thalassica TaxID=1715693 RepID=UPI0026E20473|nr:MFS transporter [Shimia thalassica]MDO6482611.1 MFS transporter [Shimia thalassica]
MYPRVALFSMMLAAASLPLYIHLPRFATTELGLSLSVVGTLLIGLRVMDFVQDPLLGWLVDRFPSANATFAALATLGMGTGFLLLFSVPPLVQPVLWVSLTLILLFTSYSLGAILFYSQSTALAQNDGSMIRLAGFREAGALIGVILAALAPIIFAALTGTSGYAAFGVSLAVLCAVVWHMARPLWTSASTKAGKLTFSGLHQSGSSYLLLLALVNALPVAMTSTLFLFFVEDRLNLTGMSGAFLVLFFVSAGLSVPVWTHLCGRFGVRQVLLPAMALAILCFFWAALLQSGDAFAFALVCIGSGAALGADMVILPVLFSSTLERAGLQAGQAFGLWFFAGKLALALAAATLLPLLDLAGFQPGSNNSVQALNALGFAYAVVPCLVKFVAIALVLRMPKEVSYP